MTAYTYIHTYIHISTSAYPPSQHSCINIHKERIKEGEKKSRREVARESQRNYESNRFLVSMDFFHLAVLVAFVKFVSPKVEEKVSSSGGLRGLDIRR